MTLEQAAERLVSYVASRQDGPGSPEAVAVAQACRILEQPTNGRRRALTVSRAAIITLAQALPRPAAGTAARIACCAANPVDEAGWEAHERECRQATEAVLEERAARSLEASSAEG